MYPWLEFVLAFALFLTSHSVPARPEFRSILISRLGRTGYTVLYSLVSLLLLAWLISATGRAPFIPLWPLYQWSAVLALALMLITCLLLSLSIGRPNPFSFGGWRNERFDPSNPGIVAWTRHPLLLAIGIWSGAHLAANGDLAHIMLFGSFLVTCMIGARLLDRRKRTRMGVTWTDLDRQRRRARSTLQRRQAGPMLFRLSLGICLFLLVLMLHAPLFGPNPLISAGL